MHGTILSPHYQSSSVQQLQHCMGCECLIMDSQLIKMFPDCFLHEHCAVCSICNISLMPRRSSHSFSPQWTKCYVREKQLFCRAHYFEYFVPKTICAACNMSIQLDEFACKLRNEIVYHFRCLRCVQCKKKLKRGDRLVLGEQCRTIKCAEHIYANANDEWPMAAANGRNTFSRIPKVGFGNQLPNAGEGIPKVGFGNQLPNAGGIPKVGFGNQLPNAGEGIPKVGFGNQLPNAGEGIPKVGFGNQLPNAGEGIPKVGFGNQLPNAGEGIPKVGSGNQLLNAGEGIPKVGFGNQLPNAGEGIPKVGFGNQLPTSTQSQSEDIVVIQAEGSEEMFKMEGQRRQNVAGRADAPIYATGRNYTKKSMSNLSQSMNSDKEENFRTRQISSDRTPFWPFFHRYPQTTKKRGGNYLLEDRTEKEYTQLEFESPKQSDAEAEESSSSAENEMYKKRRKEDDGGGGDRTPAVHVPPRGRRTNTPGSVPQYPSEMYAVGEQFSREVEEDEQQKVHGNKRRGPRTTISQKQLGILNRMFDNFPKPSKHERAKLALDSGLSMRVIQVWFQNRRSKERRLKHLCNFLRHYERHPRHKNESTSA
uniref:Uncharacterized protein n=1 Tax=Globodera rostochiensis TaxID=31243 RepID=A0A914HEJ0_GLORO